MRAINHALTGAFLGFVLGEPALAVPAAVASHFVCDVIPHYDLTGVHSEQQNRRQFRSRAFRYLLVADAALCALLVAVLFALSPHHWLLAAICAFAAAAPDFLWLRHYVAVLRNVTWRPSKFDVFAGRIQWFQRPIGWVVEVAWSAGFIALLMPFLH